MDSRCAVAPVPQRGSRSNGPVFTHESLAVLNHGSGPRWHPGIDSRQPLRRRRARADGCSVKHGSHDDRNASPVLTVNYARPSAPQLSVVPAGPLTIGISAVYKP